MFYELGDLVGDFAISYTGLESRKMVGSKLLMLANISSDIPWNDKKENVLTFLLLSMTFVICRKL